MMCRRDEKIFTPQNATTFFLKRCRILESVRISGCLAPFSALRLPHHTFLMKCVFVNYVGSSKRSVSGCKKRRNPETLNVFRVASFTASHQKVVEIKRIPENLFIYFTFSAPDPILCTSVALQLCSRTIVWDMPPTRGYFWSSEKMDLWRSEPHKMEICVPFCCIISSVYLWWMFG